MRVVVTVAAVVVLLLLGVVGAVFATRSLAAGDADAARLVLVALVSMIAVPLGLLVNRVLGGPRRRRAGTGRAPRVLAVLTVVGAAVVLAFLAPTLMSGLELLR